MGVVVVEVAAIVCDSDVIGRFVVYVIVKGEC